MLLIFPPSPRILPVGAGEDADEGRGPLWPPVVGSAHACPRSIMRRGESATPGRCKHPLPAPLYSRPYWRNVPFPKNLLSKARVLYRSYDFSSNYAV
jgi:hypothetical protein